MPFLRSLIGIAGQVAGFSKSLDVCRLEKVKKEKTPRRRT
jgi:hypothetical protein